MSTTRPVAARVAKSEDLSLDGGQLVETLIKHFGLHEGIFDLQLEFKIGATTAISGVEKIPGLAFGISKFGLKRTDKASSPFSRDAAVVNGK